ncbi:MAG TPA: hypothetical protein VE994_15455 [Terriglobales bacterium]|nr:hypothetical protein [Terriglobales bacterium]
MHTSKHATRRSSRVPVNLPVLVTSLKPGTHFSEICETMVVNAHGCALKSPVQLDAGAPLHFHSKEGRETMAQVVDCQPLGPDERGWKLAVRLDKPENFWGLNTCPEDWMNLLQLPNPAQKKLLRQLMSMNSDAPLGSASPAVIENIERQLSDEHLRALISEVVHPLKTVVTNLKEKLAGGEPRRSKFEVSLSQIPPELEEKLWVRLKQDLGTQVLSQVSEQSQALLSTANDSIHRKLNETRDEFRQHVSKELQTVEQRAQGMSAGLTDTLRQHLQKAVDEITQRSTDAGNRMGREAEDLFRSLQQHLEEDHDAHCQEMRRIQAEFAAESSRLQAQVADLNGRIAQLDDSARQLESELERRLAQLATDTVSTARTQLEGAVETVLQDLGTRNARELQNQLDHACARLKHVQRETEVSVGESVKNHIAAGVETFERTIEDVGRHAVGGWRTALANRLNSLARVLGEQFPMEATSDRD